MKISRRSVLHVSGLAAAALALTGCSVSGSAALGGRLPGLLKGLLLTVWWLLRCQPFARFGYDPVPPKGRWVSDDRKLTRG